MVGSPPSRKLNELPISLDWQSIPRDVQTRIQWLVRDYLAVSFAGRQTQAARISADYVTRTHAEGSSTLLFDGRRSTVPGAAFANGVLADALCFTDGHVLARGHPGANVIPAALAVAQEQDATVGEFLASVVLGFEVAVRAGIALHARDSSYHGAGTWGALGAAASAAALYHADFETFTTALGLAEYQAPVAPILRSVANPAMTKDAIGWGAMVGCSSAMLAGAGFSALPSEFVESGSLSTIGHIWMSIETYVKRFPCCRWSHPAIKGMLDLRAQHRLSPDNICAINVRTFATAAKLATGVPRTTEQAQYSLVWPVAYAAAHGAFGIEAILDSRDDKAASAILPLITVVVDAEFESQYPERRLTEVTIVTSDGSRYASGAVEADGEYTDPQWESIVAEKFERFVKPAPPPGAGQKDTRLGNLTTAALVDVIAM